jgi:hypothetical protein
MPVIGHQTLKVITRNEEGPMCPVCIANAAAMVAGAGSTGGVLAVCIGKLKKFVGSIHLGLDQKARAK